PERSWSAHLGKVVALGILLAVLAGIWWAVRREPAVDAGVPTTTLAASAPAKAASSVPLVADSGQAAAPVVVPIEAAPPIPATQVEKVDTPAPESRRPVARTEPPPVSVPPVPAARPPASRQTSADPVSRESPREPDRVPRVQGPTRPAPEAKATAVV